MSNPAAEARLVAAAELPAGARAVAIGWFADGTSTSSDAAHDSASLARRGFRGGLGESLLTGEEGRTEVLLGLGERTQLDAEAWRRAGAALTRATAGIGPVALDLRDGAGPVDARRLAQAVGEGALLAAYRFTDWKGETSEATPPDLELVGAEPAAYAAGLERATVIVRAVGLARDLVNTPPSELTPADFAARATEEASRSGLEIEVFEEDAIAEMHLGGLLGVARGSAEPPRLVRLAYEPGGNEVPTVSLVGKGITFDSGGLSLKSPEGMETMKTDMSGAAAVLATLGACRELGIGVRVVGFCPLTENMPGGRAIKPGDVLRIHNGTTIEVLNTDAEGRLVLADALSLAAEEAPDAIVDLATLTGACVVALGKRIAGLMGNDDRLVAALRAAGAAAGEASWPLPLPAAYRSDITSEVADLKNIGARGQAGALAAGLLLEEFVGDVPWAHLDIAGPARTSSDSGYLRSGATGFGVRTLLELLGAYEPLGGRAAGAAGKEILR